MPARMPSFAEAVSGPTEWTLALLLAVLLLVGVRGFWKLVKSLFMERAGAAQAGSRRIDVK